MYEIEPEGEVGDHRVGLANGGEGFIVWEARAATARVVGVVTLQWKTAPPHSDNPYTLPQTTPENASSTTTSSL